MHCRIAIMAGGKGTRLAGRSEGLPKPMVPILGEPLLRHQIELCRRHGFLDILLLVHYKHKTISDYFGNGEKFGVRIQYQIEDEPRGTAGALADALHLMSNEFIVMYGDTFIDVDLERFFNFHRACDTDATLFLHPNDHPYDSDLVKVDEHGFVRKIYPYPHPKGKDFQNLVNAALYVFRNEKLCESVPSTGQFDIAKHLVPALISKGVNIKAYVSPEYIKDMGTPDRLDKVEHDFKNGISEKLSSRQLRSAVFLDRDGTLNREVNHLASPDEITLLPHVGEAVKLLNKSGLLAVVATNQPVLARGDVTLDGLDRIHARLETLLGDQRAYLDAIYFCPHHPDKGFDGEVPELKVICDCRKPATGLIDAAVNDLNISRNQSWMIGDTTSDIEAGRRAGVKTILLRSGYAGRDKKHAAKPDYTATNLLEAVQWITKGHVDVRQQLAPIALQLLKDHRLVLVGGLARSGKSSVAQALKECLEFYGKTAHVLSLDGWMKPVSERAEGAGVLQRYDITRSMKQISALARSTTRQQFNAPLYDRATRDAGSLCETLSIGPEDIIILEGVTALQMLDFSITHGTLKIYVDVSEKIRNQRILDDYNWRGFAKENIEKIITSRNIDEAPSIRQSAVHADYTIKV